MHCMVCKFEKWSSSYGKKWLRPFFYGCHGNTEIHTNTKFHFLALHGLSSYTEKCLRPFFVHGRHGNSEIHMCTKFHFHPLHGLQV